MARYSRVSQQVIELMSNHPGKPFSSYQLEAELNDVNQRQILDALNKLHKVPESGIAKVQRGVYMWRNPLSHSTGQAAQPVEPPAATNSIANGVLFEAVRDLKNGAVLLEREDGTLWVARPLDV